MKNKIYNVLIPLLVFVQPIIDIITSFMMKNNMSITAGIITKMFILLLALIYLVFIDKNKNKNIIYIALIFVIVVINLYNNGTVFNEHKMLYAGYLFKYLYLMIMLVYFVKWILENGEIKLSEFRIPLIILGVSFILSFITKTGIESYDSTRIGTSFWFSSANELGAFLSILFPISVYNLLYLNDKKIIDWFNFILCYFALFALGTKTGLLASIITLFCCIIYKLINIKKEKNNLKYLVILVLFLLPFFFWNSVPAVHNTKSKIKFEKIEIKKPDNKSIDKEAVSRVVLSGRDKFNEEIKEKSESVTSDNKFLNKLVGKSYVKDNKILIVEQDLKDINNMFGIISLIIVLSIILYIIVKIGITILFSNGISNPAFIYLSISLFLALGISYISGHMLLSASVSTYFCLIFAMLNREIKKIRNNENNVMFISSVGGHLTQLLTLKEVFNKYNYVLVTEKTDVTKNMSSEYNIRYLKYGSRKYILNYIFIAFCNIFKSLYLILKYNPKVIVTTGTHTAVPMCYYGWIFGRKIIYIESFAKRTSPTLTGRLIYPIATTFVVQWESMLKFYPKAEYWGGIY